MLGTQGLTLVTYRNPTFGHVHLNHAAVNAVTDREQHGMLPAADQFAQIVPDGVQRLVVAVLAVVGDLAAAAEQVRELPLALRRRRD